MKLAHPAGASWLNLFVSQWHHDQSISNPLIVLHHREASLQELQSLKLSALPGCYPTDLGKYRWLMCARAGRVADGRWCNDAWDYTRLSASQAKQINLPTQNADPKNISYHGLHTLPDSCPAANTAKPAGLSRKGQWHTGLISTSLLLSLVFWQSCQLPLFHRPKKQNKKKTYWVSEWVNHVGTLNVENERRESFWNDRCHICPSGRLKNGHVRITYKCQAPETLLSIKFT